jgi:phospholipid/cholesterol/gamma-HCH transport system substrate-binding protein
MKKDWRERELTMEVIVGAFIVMIFLGLGYFTIILSKEAWFTEKTEMKVTFGNVMGLRDGDSVVARGMPMGKVKTLQLSDAETCSGVCVTLILDTPLAIREGYQIKVVSTSILGGRQLQINEGPATAPVLDLDVYQGKDPYDIMEDAADIVNVARSEIVEGEVFRKIRNVVEQIDAIVTRVNAGEGSLGKVLSADDTLYSDIAASAASVRTLLSRVEEGQGTVGKLLSEDSTLHDDITAAVSALKSIAEGIEKGEGSVGRLLKDDGLYNDVEATVSEVRAAIDDFRETAPITTFSSIFFGAF